MKIILEGPEAGQERSATMDDKLLSERAILLCEGVHYVFNRFDGYSVAVRFTAVQPPIEIVMPKPEPSPRKFFGQAKDEQQ